MVVTKITLLHQKKVRLLELETDERKITVKLSLVKANKSSTKQDIKLLETELENIKNKRNIHYPSTIF